MQFCVKSLKTCLKNSPVSLSGGYGDDRVCSRKILGFGHHDAIELRLSQTGWSVSRVDLGATHINN